MKGGANIGEVLVISLGLIILIIMIMFLYNYFTKTYTSQIEITQLFDGDEIYDASEETNIDNSVLARNNLGNEYNLNLWMYISHFEKGPKTVLIRKDGEELYPYNDST